MTDPGNNYGRSRVSPNLDRLFSSKHTPSRELLTALDIEDLQVLRRAARGEVHPERRVQALAALAFIQDPEGCEVAGDVLANDEEEPALRAVAASNLGLCPPEVAEQRLIAGLYVSDEVVLVKVIKALGQIGSESGLAALDQLSGVGADFVDKQLRLAKALISYRLGLDRDILPFVEGARR